ncbi:somatostatin-like receptor F_48D10.1 [Salarias fasciatus]|uniref:somatostatin-like receptor F_48D10.1 n=1 Tax=Salarias fasciatus TaxID=181472 RepID=UPI001176DDEA|nr:somatostatin-like receptor F_48D10.1 [Salarias fasciatus]XP_029950836.1 somatostatin-like receptor F_48D10.1 [Salarias fasciatus]
MEPLDQNYWYPLSSDLNSSGASPPYLLSPFSQLYNISNMSTHSAPFEGSSTLLTAVIYLTVFVVGLIGNTLAIYVVLRYAKMKTVTNIYILNLAVADELYIIGLPFLTTQNVLSYWPFGSFLCRVVMTADSMNQFTSIFCLTVMSIDRYLAVVHPIRSTKWRHPRVAKVVSAAVWGVSFVVVLPVVIFSDVQDKFYSCNMIWPEPNNLWSTAFILYTAIVGFFGPLLIICLCYLLIVIKVKSSGARAGFTKRRRSERKVTRMVVVFVLVFVLCWLPFFIINMVNLVVIIPESSVTAGIYFFAVILSYANSCANPLLYGFLSDNFKQSIRKVLCVSTLRCSTNGVDDGDPNAARSEKTTANECILLSHRDQVYQGPQSSQISPHPLVSLSSPSAADLRRSSASLYQFSSACPGSKPTAVTSAAAATVTTVITVAEPPTVTALTTPSSSMAPQEQ